MKGIFFAAMFALAGQALAGEDSTDHWGVGGTGPAWYQTKCGLAGFPGPMPYPDNQRPCSNMRGEPVEVFIPGAAVDPSRKERGGVARESAGREAQPSARADVAR